MWNILRVLVAGFHMRIDMPDGYPYLNPHVEAAIVESRSLDVS